MDDCPMRAHLPSLYGAGATGATVERHRPAPFLLLALVYGLAALFASWWIGAIIVGGGLAVGTGAGEGLFGELLPALRQYLARR